MRCFDLNKSSKEKYIYKIAESSYQSNLKLNELEYLHLVQHPSIQINTKSYKQSTVKHQVFDDICLIGDKQFALNVKSMSDLSYCLKCDLHQYNISKNNIKCTFSDVDITVLLGPVLIINLAINYVFCLHASAFLIKDKLFILMGDSGTGKSTIARFFHEQTGCQRIADDILPMKIVENQLTILPSFPQLKLADDEQYTGGSIVKETILLFAQKSEEKTCLKSIKKFDALKKIINHSVATKLFAQKELKNHLSFCHKTSTLVKNYRLKYQHSRGSLNQLYNLLNEII